MNTADMWLAVIEQPGQAVSNADDTVLVIAVISGLVAVVVAWIGRPARAQRREVGRQLGIIEENTAKTGNGWTERLGTRLERMETRLEAQIDLSSMQHETAMRELSEKVGRLDGRLDEHLRQQATTKEKTT